jgi:aminoglycoside phosphotransferase (APT) family kinase protein
MTDIRTFTAALNQALIDETSSPVEIRNLAQIPGGASHELWRFDLTVSQGRYAGEHALVMQRPLGGKIFADALDQATEFQVLQAVYAAGLPVPRPYWLLANLQDRPAALAARLAGEAIGRRVVRDTNLAEARKLLPTQMGAALAGIHQVDLEATGLLARLPGPAARQTPAQAQILQMEADLDRIEEPHPALELALRWLRRNEPPAPERLVLIHGDYRIGNMLVTSEGLNGVLDWEFAHLGDPAEDLAWGLIREWRFGVDQLRFGGIAEVEPFFAAYASHSGQPVDEARVFYWEVMHNVRWAVGTLNQARRHLSGLEPNLEFASLGRRCAEMEYEALRLVMSVE